MTAVLDRRIRRLLVAWGLTVWFGVAVLVRLAGHVLLSPANPLLVAGFFGAAVPLMAAVTYPVYRRLGLDARTRPRAAALMSLPGMFLDVGLVLGAATAFPRMETAAVANFGAILLFGYAVVLLTGFAPRGETAPAATDTTG